MVKLSEFYLFLPWAKRKLTWPQGGGGYSGFQVTGMIEGFLGGRIFRFLEFFGLENFGKYFLGSLIEVGSFLGIKN